MIKLKNKIIHIDIDAFYASVEELDNPSLKGKPLAVGGLSDRGIVATVNYPARRYGIHSAMPIFMARALCPSLIVVKSNREKYLKKSKEVFNIIADYSRNMEKVSIDECYIDLSHSNEPVNLAMDLKRRILKETGLTVSMGLSYNKFLAKIASDWKKPDGFMIISDSDMPEILYKLDINKVHGLGEMSQEKLRKIGINTIEDLMGLKEDFLFDLFGKMGIEIYERIRGIDRREVIPDRTRKSMGVERTFLETNNKKELNSYLDKYSKELAEDLKKYNLGFKTLTLKLKTHDFKTSTHSKTYSTTIKSYEDILEKSKALFKENYTEKKLRLMGISASNLVDLDTIQLSFKDIKNPD